MVRVTSTTMHAGMVRATRARAFQHPHQPRRIVAPRGALARCLRLDHHRRHWRQLPTLPGPPPRDSPPRCPAAGRVCLRRLRGDPLITTCPDAAHLPHRERGAQPDARSPRPPVVLPRRAPVRPARGRRPQHGNDTHIPQVASRAARLPGQHPHVVLMLAEAPARLGRTDPPRQLGHRPPHAAGRNAVRRREPPNLPRLDRPRTPAPTPTPAERRHARAPDRRTIAGGHLLDRGVRRRHQHAGRTAAHPDRIGRRLIRVAGRYQLASQRPRRGPARARPPPAALARQPTHPRTTRTTGSSRPRPVHAQPPRLRHRAPPNAPAPTADRSRTQRTAPPRRRLPRRG